MNANMIGRIALAGQRICRFSTNLLQSTATHEAGVRWGSYYTIDDDLFGLTEDQKQLRQTVFNFAQEEIAPKAQQIDKDNVFQEMPQCWKKLGQLGLLGITAPFEYGGSASSITDQCIAMEEITRASAAVSISYAAHSNLCVNQLVRNGTEEQKQIFLPKLCSGDHIGALAMSEMGSGSDVVSMKCRAEKKGDYYILNGSKFWITNGPVADVIIVYAKTDFSTSQPQHGVTTFVVEKGMPGFRQGAPMDKLGHRGSPTGELIFEDCKVPASNVVGAENRGIYVLFSGLDIERTMVTASAVGIMQACCDAAFEYAHVRKQFGSEIGKFQLMQGMMADMYSTLTSCRSYLYNVARAMDRGDIVAKDVAATLLLAAEKSVDVASNAIQILGGNGYINDYPVGRYWRDAKLLTIGGGTTEIRKIVIGRALNAEYLH